MKLNFSIEAQLVLIHGNDCVVQVLNTASPTERKHDQDGFVLALPPATHIEHEAQFPNMLDQFLDLVETDVWPAELAARIRTRYSLLACARDRALAL